VLFWVDVYEKDNEEQQRRDNIYCSKEVVQQHGHEVVTQKLVEENNSRHRLAGLYNHRSHLTKYRNGRKRKMMEDSEPAPPPKKKMSERSLSQFCTVETNEIC
jgi:hypothetical protein